MAVLAVVVVRAKAESAAAPTDQFDEIQVTAERLGLMGTAATASEGIVVNEELALTDIQDHCFYFRADCIGRSCCAAPKPIIKEFA